MQLEQYYETVRHEVIRLPERPQAHRMWGDGAGHRTGEILLEETKLPMGWREDAVLKSEPPATTQEARVSAYFNSGASYWDDVYRRHDVLSLRYQERFKSVLQLVDKCSLPPGSHILDVGCGAGVYSVALARRGYFVEAVDGAPAMLDRTRHSAVEAQVDVRIRTTMGTAYDLPFDDGAFPMMLAIGVIPWLASPQMAITELARVIKPGGYLLMTADNRGRLDVLLDPLKCPAFSRARQIVKTVFGVSYWRWHAAPADTLCASDHSVREVDDLLATAGLKSVHVETLGFGPFTFFAHEFLPNRLGVKLHRVLQRLANQGYRGIRSAGWQIVVLARKGL